MPTPTNPSPGFRSIHSVPESHHVAIDGRDYIIDPAQLRRQVMYRVRNTVFQTGENSELMFNDEGYWIRSQVRWDGGSGQFFFDSNDDDAEGVRDRYLTGFNVDPWEDHQLGLGPKPDEIYLSSSVAERWVTDGTYVVGWEEGGDYFRYHDDVSEPSFTWNTYTDAGVAISDVVALPGELYYASDDGLKRRTIGGSATQLHATNGDRIWYVNDRLLMSSNSNTELKEYRSGSPWTETAVHTLVFGYTWADIVGTPVGIFAAATNGRHSIIYFFGSDATSSDLDPPVVAGELPYGETITSLYHYANVILIGTTLGIRVASYGVNALSNGVLEINKAVQLFSCTCDGYAVQSMVGFGRYVYFGYDHWVSPYAGWSIGNTYVGVGRLDLTRSTEPDTLVPAVATEALQTGFLGASYRAKDLLIVEASDYQADGTALGTTSLHLMFGVYSSSAGAAYLIGGREWRKGNRRTATGIITSSWITAKTLAEKSLSTIDIHTYPLPANTSIEVRVRYRNQVTTTAGVEGVYTEGETYVVGVISDPETELTSFDLADLPHAIDFAIELELSTTDTTTGVGPRVRGWELHLLPIPPRVEEIVVPVRMAEMVSLRDTQDGPYHPYGEYDHLRHLALTGQWVWYSEIGRDPERVRVDQVVIPDGAVRDLSTESWYEGTYLVRLLTQERTS